MERVPGEGEAHIKPDLRGRARTTRRQAGLGGNGASAEWAHAGAGNQTQVARRVLKRQRQKNEQQAALFVGREKNSRPGPKDRERGRARAGQPPAEPDSGSSVRKERSLFPSFGEEERYCSFRS